MAREFSKAFYNSREWKMCRASYLGKMPVHKRGLCEKCWEQGIHTLGLELHHKTWLTPNNMKDKSITLNHDNLIFLCFECHKKEHGNRNEKRYTIDEHGNLIYK